MTRRSVMWAAAALLGIVATAAIAWTASQIAGQRIGISSEPLSVANHLAPAHKSRPPKARRPVHRPTKHVEPAVTVTQPTYTVTQPAYTVSQPTYTPAPAPTATASSAPTQQAHGGDRADGGSSHGDD
jgi:hypothetical protein